MGIGIVIPSAGRPSLAVLLGALGPAHDDVVVVDDRPRPAPSLDVPPGVRVVSGPARGPAAARNAGWRATESEWVAFLDDDVVPPAGWREALRDDLDGLAFDVAGSQGNIRVPLPPDRPPTDWERNVAGLERARWATADLCYRRAALAAADGFDERFRRAYREDADLGLRLVSAGWRIVRGERWVEHPVGPAGPAVSLGLQRGNADDVLMSRRHGPGWRERSGAFPGRRPRHLVTAGAGVVALATRSRLAAAVWLAGTAEGTAARVKPGPWDRGEIGRMAWTSALMPFAATRWWVVGLLRHRGIGPAAPARPPRARPKAVLLDRDGTLVHDVPYNGDPAKVTPVDGAREALDRLRAAGIRLGVVSNQSGVGRGLITRQQVDAVNRRVEELLGPLGPWAVCPHAPEEECDCRKPRPGLVLRAAAALGVAPADCAVVGDIGADVGAALAAGARPILVPDSRTRPEEVAAAPEVAETLGEAVTRLLGSPA